MLRILEHMESAEHVLVTGGGFDVFAGVPLALDRAGRGKDVVFANLSFTNLWLNEVERITPITWRVDEPETDL